MQNDVDDSDQVATSSCHFSILSTDSSFNFFLIKMSVFEILITLKIAADVLGGKTCLLPP